jgi:ubiquinone/menaquinone biosynthesis C-methylase UbiE
MKLSDADRWEPESALGRLGLEGQDLTSHQVFWDRSAELDAIRSIADQDTDESFESSGTVDAEAIRPYLPADGAFLEIGCGIGRVLQHVASMCREVHGLDISAEMVKRGEERLRHLPNVHLSHGNGYDLEPYADDRFDVVYCGFVFQHMPKTTVYNYLLETHRVLKPDGVFRFQVPNILRSDQFHAFRHFAQPYFLDHPYPMHFYTPVEIVQLAVRAGFWVEELTGEIVVRARKREQAGVAPGAIADEDLSLLEGDHLLGLEERERLLRERNRLLEQRMEAILAHPVVRTGKLLRDGLRRVRGASRRLR